MIEIPSMYTINPKSLNMFMIENRKINKIKNPYNLPFLGNITNDSQGYLTTYLYA